MYLSHRMTQDTRWWLKSAPRQRPETWLYQVFRYGRQKITFLGNWWFENGNLEVTHSFVPVWHWLLKDTCHLRILTLCVHLAFDYKSRHKNQSDRGACHNKQGKGTVFPHIPSSHKVYVLMAFMHFYQCRFRKMWKLQSESAAVLNQSKQMIPIAPLSDLNRQTISPVLQLCIEIVLSFSALASQMTVMAYH